MAALDEWDIGERDDVVLVTSELVTNALEHTPHPMALTVERRDRRLRLEVSDGSAVLPIVRDLDRERPHGRGMFIIQHLTTDWGAESHPDGGKTVWVEFDLRAASHHSQLAPIAIPHAVPTRAGATGAW